MKFRFEPLGGVLVTDETCKNALEREVRYLCSLDEGRLLAGFYENAGLETPFVRYGGWESKLIGGHTLGHYLTAVAQASIDPGVSEEDRAFLSARVRRMTDALALCQAHSKGEKGFLWGAVMVGEKAEAQFDNVERGRTNITREAWVPWYTMHKLLAGLCDVYRLTGYAPALEVAEKLGDWVVRRVSGWDTRTRKRVLSVEYGGMNDCLYTLFSLTGKGEYARAAHIFDEEPLFDRILSEGKDVLDDLHANTTVPKVLGALNRYIVLGEERYLRVAEAFFRMVAERHSYVTGGVSEWERFGRDAVLDARRTNCNCETCISYNLMKLSRLLFLVTGEKKYADECDLLFTNSILPSQDPTTGMTTYFQPMASGFFKVFSTPYQHFWCCTGSGMENFTKLGDGIFFVKDGEIYIERYLSARAKYGEAEFELSCDFPLEDSAVLRLSGAERPIIFHLRIPDWAEGDIRFEGVRAEERDGHAVITLAPGQEVRFHIPLGISLKGLPDGNALAFLYGGAVLSADLGTEDMREAVTGVDVSIPARAVGSEELWFDDVARVLASPSDFLVRDGDTFVLTGADRPLRFGLHYKRYRERYGIYFRFFEYLRENGVRKKPERARREAVDAVQAGYGQYENDGLHELAEQNSAAGKGSGRYARAGGWFRYDLRVDPARENLLVLTLSREDNGRPLTVTAGGEVLFSETLRNTMDEGKYLREISLPADLVRGYSRKKSFDGGEADVLTVTFGGSRSRRSACVYEVRIETKE